MGETREVQVMAFIGNLFVNPTEFANDAVDALDAKVKLSPVWENLSDTMKGTLKSALAEVIVEKIHGPMSDKTITCES